MGDQEEYKIRARSLGLLEKRYGGKGGFVIQGPVKLLRARGAVIRKVEFSDHETAWKHLKKLIDDARRRKVRNKAFSD